MENGISPILVSHCTGVNGIQKGNSNSNSDTLLSMTSRKRKYKVMLICFANMPGMLLWYTVLFTGVYSVQLQRNIHNYIYMESILGKTILGSTIYR